MNTINEKINHLVKRLEVISNNQQTLTDEIQRLKAELFELQNLQSSDIEYREVDRSLRLEQSVDVDDTPVNVEVKETIVETVVEEVQVLKSDFNKQRSERVAESENDKQAFSWERFIGENLISKIGIAITVIGVAIGAKYSIDNNLISPIARIIIGYVLGLGILGLGIKLKEKYHNYSAILVSGAMSILFFLTFFAYSYYKLYPQWLTFIMLCGFTVFTVLASLKYNNVYIALFGMIGAYVVPFLVGNNSGNVTFLFIYVAIINIGIIFLAYKKEWKILSYSSFIISWIIFATWRIAFYKEVNHLAIALSFVTVYFITFYSMLLIQKVVLKQVLNEVDMIMFLCNNLVFYALGMSLIHYSSGITEFKGLFTLFNALIYVGTAYLLKLKQHEDKDIFYTLIGLALGFVTLTIPIQLKGNWITLFWAIEAAVLYWVGSTRSVKLYKYFSWPIMGLTLIMFIPMMNELYGFLRTEKTELNYSLFINKYFATFSVVLLSFVFVLYTWYKQMIGSLGKIAEYFQIEMLLFWICIGLLYSMFMIEFDMYLGKQYLKSGIVINPSKFYNEPVYNTNLIKLHVIYKLLYTIGFVILFSFIGIKQRISSSYNIIFIFINYFVLFVIFTFGLVTLSELVKNYLNNELSKYFYIGELNVLIRYVLLSFSIVLIIINGKLVKRENEGFNQFNLQSFNYYLNHILVFVLISTEYFNVMNLIEYDGSYKLGLSILWGLYALFYIVLGIWKRIKTIRFIGIGLFAIILIKLFLVDLTALNTIAKTVLFVVLGLLLLLVSFLYNKYKHLLYDDEK